MNIFYRLDRLFQQSVRSTTLLTMRIIIGAPVGITQNFSFYFMSLKKTDCILL